MKILLLALLASFRIPIPEISGLGWFPAKAGTFLAVGDKELKVSFVTPTEKKVGFRNLDLSGLFAARPSGSQFEGVASDASGRIFILEEAPGHVFVLSATGKEIERTIELHVPKEHALYEDWKADDNSRGEGLVLLKNGHLLVIKEKKPVTLMEFAPEGEKAAGYRAGDAVTGRDTFPLPKANMRFVPIETWPVKHKKAKDVSELAVGPDGALYFLSDKSQTILKVELPVAINDEEVSITKVWDLPQTIEKAEGLILDAKTTWVAEDHKEDSENLFKLPALE